jgi:TolA-binding protein
MTITRCVAASCLCIGIAACATPGQVRRVETQVAILDRDHARADSARAADLARLQAAQRSGIDSINASVQLLTERVLRLSRETNSNFDNLRQQLYQVANLASNTQSRVQRLGNQIETAVSSAPVPTAGDTTRPPAGAVPQPDMLLDQAGKALESGAPAAARIALTTLLQTYPTAPQVAEALFQMGKSYDPAQADSARTYYTRVSKEHGDSPRAPTALYKLGMLELRAGNTRLARSYWQQIVDKYKQSDEYGSAVDRLRENPS